MVAEYKTRDLGLEAEAWACRYLQSQGLELIEKNFSCRCGEIDLIMQDQDELVFVEVRMRQHSHIGNALESVTIHKQRRLIKTALFYLQKTQLLDRVNCRFDVIGMDNHHKMTWIKNAFGLGFI